MGFKLVSLLVLALPKIVILEEAANHEFDIVSTSQRPSQSQLVDERLAKIEEKLEFYVQLAETSRRLEALELQNRQIQKTLENMNLALANFTGLQTEITANTNKLEAIELHNKQIEQKLENSRCASTNCPEIGHRLEEIVLQNKHIQKKLQNIDSVLTDNTNQSQSAQPNETFAKDCQDIKERGGDTSRIYRIKPNPSSEPFSVLCNMDSREGGWTYILNRFDGSQDFYLNWIEYKNGFGNLGGEFWLGLEHLYQLTGNEINELLIEVVDQDQKEVYAHYKAFSIGNESEGYPLKVLGEYSGTAGDSLTHHLGQRFSTKDRDHDLKVEDNCAKIYSGAWWYTHCYQSQLTGKYLKGNLAKAADAKGIFWNSYRGDRHSLKQARMMIKKIYI